eukprot:TRINITY_DN32085_c0_g1_i2.p1 TRINITY_DN32085_c0_g1~~TRINITY_DN32085_c0_g1_i2.p1  ORF type:complete len:222 (-),score=57.18 TRINITY_DN32085_c0_g1_i2:319-984(-)
MGATTSTCMTACADCKQTGVRMLGDPLDQALAQGNPPQRYEHSETIGFGGGSSSSTVPLAVEAAGAGDNGHGGDDYDDDYEDQSPEQAAEAQKTIAKFTKGMVKGRTLPVLATNGSTIDCIVALDKKLHNLSIQRAGKKDAKKRAIALEEIEKVSVGTDCAEESGLPLDEFCVVFVLKEGQAIAFRIDEIEERDTFALILAMFVDQRTTEVERKKIKAGKK